MARTFVDLRTEFFARGFEYLDDGAAGLVRAKSWLNRAMHKIDGAADWPYASTTAIGVAPLTIADLRTIEDVYDSTNRNPLRYTERRALRRGYGDLTVTGAPSYYYVVGGATVTPFPVATVSLIVDYWRFGPDLVNDTDQPLMPDRFRQGIIEYAVQLALEDDGSPDAAIARTAGDTVVQEMRDALLGGQQHGGPQWVVPAVGDDC